MAKNDKRRPPPAEQYGDKVVAHNRRARFDYELGEAFEAGISLVGTEVKMLRLGKADLSEAFIRVERGEAFLLGANIPELPGSPYGHQSKRPRKLLLHRREIEEIERAIAREGMTAVATMLYFRGGRAKIELRLARGKKHYDKRETLKKRDADREARAVAGGRR